MDGNKLGSDNQLANVGSYNNVTINNTTTDFFGIYKSVQAYFDYKKYQITITQQNLEPLHHLIRKALLTTQPKTQDFTDSIFKLYEEGDVKISMATLRVIEYMDDELLEAIIAIYDIVFANKQKELLCINIKSFPEDNREYCFQCIAKMREFQLVWQPGGALLGGEKVFQIHQPALDIYNMYKSR